MPSGRAARAAASGTKENLTSALRPPISGYKNMSIKSKPPLESLILEMRGQKIILDADLAELYGVPTKVFNQAVKRNADRFPEDFRFELTIEEAKAVQHSRSQIVTLKRGQNIKYLPHAFTEHGTIMAII